MRTVDDLRGAFALLEQQADAYAPDVVPLRAAPSARCRRPAVWLSAAVVAAALALTGTVVWTATRDARAPSGGQLPDGTPITADQLTLPFVLDPSTGYQLTQVTVSGTGEVDVNLADASHRLMLVLWPKGSSGQSQHGITHVDVDGVTADYSEQYQRWEVAPAATSAADASGAPSSVPAPSPSSGMAWQREAQWEYAPGRRVLLGTFSAPLGGDVAKEDLLRVARALDFSRTTPLRTPFELSHAPHGYPLTDVRVDLGTDGEVGGYSISGGWMFSAVYRRGHDDGYNVSVDRVAAAKGEHAVPTSTRVHGRPSTWDPGSHTFTVDLGHAMFLHITPYTWGPAPTATVADDAAIAQLVTLTATPDDETTWFDAADALPLT